MNTIQRTLLTAALVVLTAYDSLLHYVLIWHDASMLGAWINAYPRPMQRWGIAHDVFWAVYWGSGFVISALLLRDSIINLRKKHRVISHSDICRSSH